MEQVSHIVFYPCQKVLERRKLPKSHGVMGLLQGAKCVLYDTAGQRELSVSEPWLQPRSMAERYREIHHRMCPFKNGFPHHSRGVPRLTEHIRQVTSHCQSTQECVYKSVLNSHTIGVMFTHNTPCPCFFVSYGRSWSWLASPS